MSNDWHCLCWWRQCSTMSITVLLQYTSFIAVLISASCSCPPYNSGNCISSPVWRHLLWCRFNIMAQQDLLRDMTKCVCVYICNIFGIQTGTGTGTGIVKQDKARLPSYKAKSQLPSARHECQFSVWSLTLIMKEMWLDQNYRSFDRIVVYLMIWSK